MVGVERRGWALRSRLHRPVMPFLLLRAYARSWVLGCGLNCAPNFKHKRAFPFVRIHNVPAAESQMTQRKGELAINLTLSHQGQGRGDG